MAVTKLISIDYFVVQLSIPNRAKVDVVEDINFLIDKYQKEFMLDMFGPDLYASFWEADLTTEPWKTLKSLIVDEETKTSPLANIVYYHYHRNNQTQTVGLGEVKAKTENAAVADMSPKLERVWNEMSRKIKSIHEYARTNFDAVSFPRWSCVWDKYGISSII